MEGTNNYQDLTALLATLSSYVPSATVNGQETGNVEASFSYDPNAAFAAVPAGEHPVLYQSQGANTSYAEYYPQQHASAQEISNHYDPYNPASTQQYSHAATPVNLQPHLIHQYDPTTIHNQASSQHSVSQPQHTTTTWQPKPSTPQVNPRTITTWPAAIRHVTFLATQHAHLAASIRKLIANQHENEQQWHASRVALLEKQKARVMGKRELDDVLRSVGALARVSRSGDSGNGVIAGEDKANVQELQLYDRKVHRAAVQMNKAMTADLETLGVPFFGTEPGLVFDDDCEDDPTGTSWKRMRKDDVVEPDRKGKIGKGELKVLQRKMISHLEDMYKD